jgi:Transposase
MSRGYSLDLRTRLVECVEAGASRHEAAERFEVSVSSAVRWMQRWERRRQTKRRQHVAVGSACGLASRTGRQASGFDSGGTAALRARPDLPSRKAVAKSSSCCLAPGGIRCVDALMHRHRWRADRGPLS